MIREIRDFGKVWGETGVFVLIIFGFLGTGGVVRCANKASVEIGV